MNWLDIVLFLLIGGIAVWEMTRGFGRAALDALAFYGALWAANSLSVPLASALPLNPHPAINHCVAYGLLLASLGAVALVASRFVYGMTLFHLGMFESLFGLAAGVSVGMMVAHGLMRLAVLSDPSGHTAQAITNSFVGNEMLSFSTYHSVLDTLSGATAPRPSLDLSH